MFSLRKLLTTAFALIVCLLAACNLSTMPSARIAKDINPQVQNALKQIESDGFDISNYHVTDKYLLIEGDIAFSLADLQSPSALQKTLQWRHQYILSQSEVTHITVSYDANLPQQWINSLNFGLNSWTAIGASRITFTSVSSGADIRVQYIDFATLGINPRGVIAMAPFPLSNGNPEGNLYVNSNSGGTLTQSRSDEVMVHELGHKIGFRHMNAPWEAGSSRIQIPGTPIEYDYNSIMHPYVKDWTGFGHYDTLAAISIYTEGSWSSMPGTLAQISVGSATNIWGVNSGAQVFSWTGSAWLSRPGSLTQISAAADGSVWGLNGGGQVFSWTGSSWQSRPGTLAKITVGSATNIWGVNNGAQVFSWTGSTWLSRPGSLTQISAAADGSVWGLNSGGQVFSWTGSSWQSRPGTLKSISVGSASHIWATNNGDQIWRWFSTDWLNVSYVDRLKQVSIGSDKTIWGINNGGQVFRGSFPW